MRPLVPDNVILVWLPAYSPALNPVERLWEDLKRRIDVLEAGLRSSLAALQAHVAGLIQRYTAEAIASLTGYAYLVEAVYDPTLSRCEIRKNPLTSAAYSVRRYHTMQASGEAHRWHRSTSSAEILEGLWPV